MLNYFAFTKNFLISQWGILIQTVLRSNSRQQDGNIETLDAYFDFINLLAFN